MGSAPAAVLLGIASTRGGTSIPPPNPRNRANRHWRWRAYHACRARSRVRLPVSRPSWCPLRAGRRPAGPPGDHALAFPAHKEHRWRGEKPRNPRPDFFPDWVCPPDRLGAKGVSCRAGLRGRAGPECRSGPYVAPHRSTRQIRVSGQENNVCNPGAEARS